MINFGKSWINVHLPAENGDNDVNPDLTYHDKVLNITHMTKFNLLIATALLAASAPQLSHALTLDPPSGSTLKYIESIDFTYNCMVDKVDQNKIYLTDDITGTRVYCNGFTALTSDYTHYMMGGTLSFPRVSAEGTYTFTMEAGAVIPWMSYDATNELVTAEYTIDASAEESTIFSSYTLTPAADAKLARLEKVQLQFPKVGYYDTVVIDNSKARGIMLKGAGKTYYGVDVNGYYGTYTFYFSETPGGGETVAVTAPGEYTLTIPAGLFTNGADDEEELKSNTVITADYEIDDNLDFEYSCEPASGSTVSIDSLTNLKVNFYFGSEVGSISLEPAVEGAAFSVTLNGEALEPVGNVNTDEGYMIEKFGTTVTVNLSKSLVTEDSELRITAPKGAFTVDGIASPAIDYSVTYNPPKTLTYDITPEPNVAVMPFKEVTIHFTNAETIEKDYYTSDRAGKLTSVRPGSEAITSASVKVDEDLDGNPAVVVEFTAELANDNYIFSFPKDEVKVDGQGNPLIECIFRVDSIAGVEDAATEGLKVTPLRDGLMIINPAGEEVGVYSLDGVRICRLAECVASVRLPGGTYVVTAGDRTFKIIVK